MLQAALSSLEKEAKENVYAVLDPHIQYELTINKQGEPPRFLSLSKPLHQRQQPFTYTTELNNNDSKFTTFKTSPNKYRKSNRSQELDIALEKRNVCKYNNDIEYNIDPYFGVNRSHNVNDNDYTSRSKKLYLRNSGRKEKNREASSRNNAVRASDRSRRRKMSREFDIEAKIFDERKAEAQNKRTSDDCVPKTGKVKELASKFNRFSGSLGQSFRRSKGRPKPLQCYGNQAYLDHVFSDAVEI